MSGFSESIFKILSSTSKNGKLSQIVDEIDRRFNIANNSNTKTEKFIDQQYYFNNNNIENGLTRKTLRIFISSTFKDMHGERNLMTRYIFPELIRRAKNLNIDVFPIDLRWGIINSLPDQQVEACLNEIDKCDIFIGILGERYGWKPKIENQSRSMKKLADKNLTHMATEQNLSITHLEMEYGVLTEKFQENDDFHEKPSAFFYIRDYSSFQSSLPSEFKLDFETDNIEDIGNKYALKIYDLFILKIVADFGKVPSCAISRNFCYKKMDECIYIFAEALKFVKYCFTTTKIQN